MTSLSPVVEGVERGRTLTVTNVIQERSKSIDHDRDHLQDEEQSRMDVYLAKKRESRMSMDAALRKRYRETFL